MSVRVIGQRRLGFLLRMHFLSHGQANLVRVFALGAAAWAVWLDLGKKQMQVRRYDARQLISLSWDDGITECAFVTVAVAKGKKVTDDSIITDVYTEKKQDLEELGHIMPPFEYRMKWYGEDEATARRKAAGLKVE